MQQLKLSSPRIVRCIMPCTIRDCQHQPQTSCAPQTMTGHVKGANGKLEVKKNEPVIFPIMGLEEQKEYDLYLLASDEIIILPVRKLSFKTEIIPRRI